MLHHAFAHAPYSINNPEFFMSYSVLSRALFRIYLVQRFCVVHFLVQIKLPGILRQHAGVSDNFFYIFDNPSKGGINMLHIAQVL